MPNSQILPRMNGRRIVKWLCRNMMHCFVCYVCPGKCFSTAGAVKPGYGENWLLQMAFKRIQYDRPILGLILILPKQVPT